MHRDQQSRTLLHHAVSTGSKEVVRYLLDHGKLCSWAWAWVGRKENYFFVCLFKATAEKPASRYPELTSGPSTPSLQKRTEVTTVPSAK